MNTLIGLKGPCHAIHVICSGIYRADESTIVFVNIFETLLASWQVTINFIQPFH